jgi:site-specific DNA-adenine methylase
VKSGLFQQEAAFVPNFRYPGSKARLRSWLVGMMPRSGGAYCEPFAGRGNVFWLARTTLGFKSWWLNDLNALPFFKHLQDLPKGFTVPERSRELFLRLRGSKKSLAYLLEPWLTFSGTGYTQGYSNCNWPSRGHYQRCLDEGHRLLRGVRLTGGDWYECHTQLGDGDFAYYDVPYRGCDARCYSDDTVDFKKLVRCLVKADYRWLYSEYDSPFYRKYLGKPARTRFAYAAMANNKVDRVKKREECVWSNYL